MSILKSVLTGLLESDSFVKGSKELLDTVFKSIERHFEVAKPHIVADWKNWIETSLQNPTMRVNIVRRIR